MGSGVWGLGFGVEGTGFRANSSWGVEDLGSSLICGSGESAEWYRVQGIWFGAGVEGFRFGVDG